MPQKIGFDALAPDARSGLGSLVSIQEYASFAVGGNWSLALNQALAEIVGTSTRTIWFPYNIEDDDGNYSLKTKPNPIGVGVTLLGCNPRQFLKRDYTPAGSSISAANAFIVWDGSGYVDNPNQNKGGGLQNLGLYAGDGTAGGIAMMVTGANTNSRPGYTRSQDFVITGGGTWVHGLIEDGSAVKTAGSQGMRDNRFDNCYLFRCTGDAARFINSVHLKVNGLTLADGGAGNATPRVLITGDGTTLGNSTQGTLVNLDIEGTVKFENCSRIVAMGYADMVDSETSATQCKFIGITNDSSGVTTGTTVV